MRTVEPQRRRTNSARERQMARQRKRDTMAVRVDETRPLEKPPDTPASSPFADRFSRLWDALPDTLIPSDFSGQEFVDRVKITLADTWWYVRHNPVIWRGMAAGAVLVVLLYFVSHLFSGQILPRVNVVGISVGGMSVDEAETTLRSEWTDKIRIRLIAGNETLAEIAPADLGIRLDAVETARAARNVGLKAFPFGSSVDPVLEVDYLVAQDFLLDLAEQINFPAQNAHYEWQNGEVVGINGQDGRMLDVALTIEQIQFDPIKIIDHKNMELLMVRLPPDMDDPSPYLAKVSSMVQQTIQLNGFDPYMNIHYTWPVDPAQFTSWLAAGVQSLTLREDTFLAYMQAIDSTLNPNGENLRYLSPDETTNLMREALGQNKTVIDLRVRYYETQYEIVSGDTGFAISRKTGIPYYMIEEANGGTNMDILSVGQLINVPSRDVTMPEMPVPNKRIVVDLNRQYLMAFENGQVVFEWSVSSGVENAPTSPGIYQILNHEEKATGSSSTLCNSAGLQCGTWEMNWFMGIYQVSPYLVNGFHGDVLLPNGNFLGDGLIGQRTTFGCVMSSDDQAKAMYDWAEVGTVVEIIDNDYPPLSDLGRLVQEHLRAANGV